MSDDLSDIYLKISKKINSEIKEYWAVAIIKFMKEEDTGEFECIYKIDEQSDDEHDFDVDFEMYKTFKELHSIMNANGVKHWNVATYTLYASGQFNIDFAWDESLVD